MIKIDFTKKIDCVDGQKKLQIKFETDKTFCTAITGESGTGKTIMLKVLSGLITPDEGFISVDGVVWYDSKNKINITPQNREIGMVFQDYALFPNMTVEENLLYAKNDNKKVDFLLDLVHLSGLKNKYPNKLSGGQKQRVALARAIARQPKLLLLDEPLSAIDAVMRSRLQDEIINIKDVFDINIFMVSHDITEIKKIADSVLIIGNGKIEKNLDTKDFDITSLNSEL